MPLHPLHTPDLIAAYAFQNGEYFPAERCTGRSTAIALRLIASAISVPRTDFSILDHVHTPAACRELAHKVQAFVQLLGLKHINVNITNLTVRFG